MEEESTWSVQLFAYHTGMQICVWHDCTEPVFIEDSEAVTFKNSIGQRVHVRNGIIILSMTSEPTGEDQEDYDVPTPA